VEDIWRISVATLNVKNLPDALSDKLKARAKHERRSVAQEVTCLLVAALDSTQPLSIMELQGLGKEHWRAVDTAAHVEAERASWDWSTTLVAAPSGSTRPCTTGGPSR
jgi:plasmid stability protein